MMPVYTLIVTTAAGELYETLSDFPNDETALNDTGHFVSAQHPSASVARGVGDDAEFLGAWDWNDGAKVWTAES